MLNPFKGGSSIQVGEYTFYLPPVGYTPDIENDRPNELVKCDILFEDLPKKEQKWKREPYPDRYSKKEADEKRLREKDPDYQDPELKEFRDLHWTRRNNGVWIMIKGKPIYLTGLWWLHLQWAKHDFGYPDFRWIDHRSFYTLQAAEENPASYGTIEVTIRRAGKTARLGTWLIDKPTRTFNYNAGLQSKSEDDAEKTYKKSIMPVFKRLPSFFKPIHNAKRIMREIVLNPGNIDVEETLLEGIIDYRATVANAYDGHKLGRLGLEEPGKWEKTSIEQTLAITFPCLTETKRERRVIGKMYLPSTVNEENAGGKEFKEVWDAAAPIKGNVGVNGLYRVFIGAHETWAFDEYGYCDEVAALKIINDRRKEKENYPTLLSEEIRQNPTSPEEAFMFSRDEGYYNKYEIGLGIDYANSNKGMIRQGDFVWADVSRTKVEWVDNPVNGKWMVSEILLPQEANRFEVIERFGIKEYRPKNSLRYAAGIDPLDHRKTVTGKGSLIAAAIYKKFDPMIDDETRKDERGKPDYETDCYVADYLYRSANPIDDYENIIKGCLYFGCMILSENNRVGFINWANENGYGPLLMNRPEAISGKQDVDTEGAPSNQKTIDYYSTLTSRWVNQRAHKCKHIRILQDLLFFNPAKTTKFDMAVAAGFAQMAAHERKQVYKEVSGISALDLFPVYST